MTSGFNTVPLCTGMAGLPFQKLIGKFCKHNKFVKILEIYGY
jgi:hypothetical protein